MKLSLKKAITVAALTLALGLSVYSPKSQPKLSLRNLEQKVNYTVNNVYFRLYDTQVPKDYVKSLSEKFNPRSIKILDVNDVPTDYANSLADSFSVYDIIKLYPSKVPVEYAKTLADKLKGRFRAYDIKNLYTQGIPLDYLKSLISLKNDEGKPLFDGLDMITMLSENHVFGYIIKDLSSIPSLEYVRSIVNLKNKEGKMAFDKKDIADLVRGDTPLEHAKSFAGKKDKHGKRFTGFKIRRLHQLGYDKNNLEFEDTDKPNAVIVYPTEDWNRISETHESVQLFKKIQKRYDVRLVLAEKEEEAYEAINETPNIEFLLLFGHGTEKSISLGEEDLRLFSGDKSEEYCIDMSDKELNKYLEKLNSDAVIFLISCSNAKGGENADNLANFIIKNAGGRKVIASKGPFSSKDVIVTSVYPFDAKIIHWKVGDLTYTNK